MCGARLGQDFRLEGASRHPQEKEVDILAALVQCNTIVTEYEASTDKQNDHSKFTAYSHNYTFDPTFNLSPTYNIQNTDDIFYSKTHKIQSSNQTKKPNKQQLKLPDEHVRQPNLHQ